jgi:hypothetical protein
MKVKYRRIEGFKGVTKKNTVFWDVTPCNPTNVLLHLLSKRLDTEQSSLAFLFEIYFFLKFIEVS